MLSNYEAYLITIVNQRVFPNTNNNYKIKYYNLQSFKLKEIGKQI